MGDVSAAKRATADGPVFITDRGRPAFALLKIDDYFRIAGQSEPSLLDAMDGFLGAAASSSIRPAWISLVAHAVGVILPP